MKWKEALKEYLTFSAKERTAAIILLLLLAVVFLVPPIYHRFNPVPLPQIDSSFTSAAVDTTPGGASSNFDKRTGFHQFTRFERERSPPTTSLSGERFPFDPNTASENDWKRLGLRDRTIATILNFRSKGGKFRQPGDLKKIYGLPEALAASLEPYVVIPPVTGSPRNPAALRQPVAVARVREIDINTADSAAWEALPGIGPKLAARVLLFREKLGGFYRVDQVGETFGLADSVFQRIRPLLRLTNTTVQRIAINTASLEVLKVHPYIRYALARAIVLYRTEHGLFREPGDLLKMAAATPEWVEKIGPYLSFD